jgi:uncharacterized coiled-coil protein SlyX
MKDEERFLVVETKLAYHDHHLAELDAVIFNQQRAIEQLQTQLKRVTEQLKLLGMEGDPSQFQKPPHY